VLGGGGGSVGGTLFGVITLGVINNLLNLVGVKSFYQDIVKGAVIILAVLLVETKRRKG
jgi:ribose/xylose/arabinose/galactoside ABC-type transport system permease subunit